MASKPANKAPRREKDFYATPYPLALACVERTVSSELGVSQALDLGAGDGVWGRAVGATSPQAAISGVELADKPIPPEYTCWVTGFDALTCSAYDLYDLIVSNPPFSLAEEFVCLGLRLLAPGGRAAFLLPLGFRASQTRNKAPDGLFAWAPLKELAVIVPRPSFTEDGATDATDYGLFIFEQGYDGPATLSTLWWAKPEKVKLDKAPKVR